ncbi:family 20 glycosylhydrolase [Cellulophaga sp. HaHaR_3_176]|uniref:family 20 glycosylhydrolase n=1 Tax=Cellulophaga sp. HaHaR_3_176 TaxID=1942464 RepID=UPI001C1FD8DD|nr:family 20 glycosylhydrolase [Cellulophaga sp. HaHaR_3_176]QWX82700.1 family 20 glycosylhydrolase [Cellulophaga sp. HaHaR_3_176]
MKKNLFIGVLLILISIVFISCGENKKKIILNFPETDLLSENIIPKPSKTIATNSAFGLDKNTVIYTSQTTEGFKEVGDFLSEKIKEITAFTIPVNETNSETVDRIIFINQSDSTDLQTKESYQLYITKDSIILNSKTAEGAFRGIQTLRQIIPTKSNDTITTHPMWLVPTGKIIDSPTFEYRGAMLDVARHFFSVKDVKKYIELLAYYKINALHLHLSDDQGWRIEIKSWPNLTVASGGTEVGGGKGGFYTQEDYKDIVSFAAKHHITIIPEIDMPGHTNAASVAYPFLNGNGKTPKTYTGTHVGFSTFDANKDTVYSFIDDVIKEIATISPGPYFHIGGDESHVTKKRDYVKFVSKVEKIVQKHGKQMIGWDEITQASLSTNSIAQHWSAEANAIRAAKNEMKIIMSPAKKAYLDMEYDSLSEYGLHWAAYIPVDSAYNWSPEKYIPELPQDNILGIEAPLWSETITNMAELEYLAFPRIIGYAELGWTADDNRDWDDYKKRLANQVPYLERMNVNFYKSKLIDWVSKPLDTEVKVE